MRMHMQVLRLGVYEMQFMSLAPHAVSDFVELARHLGGHEAAPRFANGGWDDRGGCMILVPHGGPHGAYGCMGCMGCEPAA